MADIVGTTSTLDSDPIESAIHRALANLDLSGVPDSYTASRYAVSSVDQGNVPTLVGAQIGGNSGTQGGNAQTIIGEDSVVATTTANLTIIKLVSDQGGGGLPGNTYYYGTGPTGTKGYWPIASAFDAGNDVELSADATGVVTIASGLFQSVAVGNISSNTVVAATTGGVKNPSLATSTDVPAIVGVAYTSATNGNAITVMKQGQLTEALWSWTPGLPIYCGLTGGAFTQTAPTTGAVVVVGVALSATTIDVDIGLSYLRN